MKASRLLVAGVLVTFFLCGLVRNGSLPPGLEKKLYPCPPDLERQLPPPPPDCAHVLVSGHIVLLNRRTNLIVDVFAL
jgi:hypothetical protein